MKKKLILLIMLATIVSFGYSQEKTNTKKQKAKFPPPSLEVWGGMGLSSVVGNISSAEYRLAGLFGAGSTLPISEKNNLHGELAYSWQGFKYVPQTYITRKDTVDLDEAEQRFNYFKLTVMDRYFLDNNRAFYVNGGFYLSYLSQARFQGAYHTDDPNSDKKIRHEIDTENGDRFTTFDFGLTGGIGVRLGNKELSNFTVEVRASYGLINIAKPGDGESVNAKNIYGIIKMGVDIPLRE